MFCAQGEGEYRQCCSLCPTMSRAPCIKEQQRRETSYPVSPVVEIFTTSVCEIVFLQVTALWPSAWSATKIVNAKLCFSEAQTNTHAVIRSTNMMLLLRSMPFFLHDFRKAIIKKELKYIKWSEGKHYQVFQVWVKKSHFMSMGNLTISFSCNQRSFFKTFTAIFFPPLNTVTCNYFSVQ